MANVQGGPASPGPAAPSGGMSSEGKAAAFSATCLILGGVMACGGIGVIGILAAIAIPNFIKFSCKAKQSEAKTHLAGIFTAEKAFYGEYGSYTSDLRSIQWGPDGTPTYLYGFKYYGPDEAIPGMTSDYDVSRADTLNADVIANIGYSTAKMRTQDGRPLAPEDFPDESQVTKDTFVAAAVGDIVGGNNALDVWTIDQDKRLISHSDDCSQ